LWAWQGIHVHNVKQTNKQINKKEANITAAAIITRLKSTGLVDQKLQLLARKIHVIAALMRICRMEDLVAMKEVTCIPEGLRCFR